MDLKTSKMKSRKNTIYLLFCFLLSLFFHSCSFRKSPEFIQSVVWDKDEGDVEAYRILGIVVIPKGTVLAFSEARMRMIQGILFGMQMVPQVIV